jgi:hypothetical protein
MAIIYLLADPRESDPVRRVRYIGMTVQRARARLGAHLNRARRGSDTHCHRWVRLLLGDGVTPLLETLFIVERTDAPATEQRAIAALLASGANLTNRTEGGEGVPGLTHTAETRDKLATAHKGRTLSPEHKQRIREANLRRWAADPSLRVRVASKLAGRKRPPEVREKIARKAAGRDMRIAQEAARAVNVGRVKSPAERQRHREAAHRLAADPAYRAKLSAGQRRRAEAR